MSTFSLLVVAAFILFTWSVRAAAPTRPRSFAQLHREGMAQAMRGAALLLGGVAAPVGAVSCGVCKEKDKMKCVCNSSALVALDVGQQAVAEQITQGGSSYFLDPRNERIYDTHKRSYIPARPDVFLPRAIGPNNRVVVVGEIHSDRCHHHAEFEVVKSLSSGEKELAIGMECFYRQHQQALDNFIFGHQDLGKLKRETNWKQAWGYDLNYYAKILRYASTKKIRLLGLNCPYPVVQLVGSAGFDSLPASIKQLLPPLDLSNSKHRRQFVDAINGGASGQGRDGDDLHQAVSMQHMYEAQTLWDEYMAESAANFLSTRNGKKTTLLVIAGLGHVLGRTGIPDRIRKRTGQDPFVILPQQVQFSEITGLPNVITPMSSSDADWIWYTQEEERVLQRSRASLGAPAMGKGLALG